MTCPHCHHSWSAHSIWMGGHQRCHCGCMWKDPAQTPPPPPPPSTRDRLINSIENTIWNALEQQDGPYVDREMGMVDASGAGLDMTVVAAAVANIFVDSEGDCSWCHSPCAAGGWSEPADVGSVAQSEPNPGGWSGAPPYPHTCGKENS